MKVFHIAMPIAGLMAAVQLHAATITCHLHVPGDDSLSEDTPSIIRSVGTPEQCEQLNKERFAGKGRCHCSFGKIRQRGFIEPERTNRPEQGMF